MHPDGDPGFRQAGGSGGPMKAAGRSAPGSPGTLWPGWVYKRMARTVDIWIEDPASTGSLLDFLGTVGVVFLLFGVGLKTDIRGLREVLSRAGWIWAGNVLLSGGVGFLAARYLLDATFLPSLMVAVALTATSVGVTVGVWDSRDALDSRAGNILLDVAELDDISAVVLMALLFAVLPTIRDPGGEPDLFLIGHTWEPTSRVSGSWAPRPRFSWV